MALFPALAMVTCQLVSEGLMLVCMHVWCWAILAQLGDEDRRSTSESHHSPFEYKSTVWECKPYKPPCWGTSSPGPGEVR